MSPRSRHFYVYIMASVSRTLYEGITNSLAERVLQHRGSSAPSFTARYKVRKLVYFEEYDDVHDAIAREKQIKGWSRAKKLDLIESVNPRWDDLSECWFD